MSATPDRDRRGRCVTRAEAKDRRQVAEQLSMQAVGCLRIGNEHDPLDQRPRCLCKRLVRAALL